ncbi:MAG: hypothetical protein HYU29_08695 [Chloroflexi bacterium]|nr:hypothetical protein [Chloroflexota bacterium]
MEPKLLGPSLILLTLLFAACTRGPAATPAASQEAPVTFYLVSTDLAVEETRFAFGLIGPDRTMIEGARASLRFIRGSQVVLEGEAIYRSVAIRTPHIHPGGEVHLHIDTRGLYVVDGVKLDTPGEWNVQARVTLPDGSGPYLLEQDVIVKGKSSTPAIGNPVPPTRHKTARDVSDLSQISSSEEPIPDFYRVSVAEAVEGHRPFVVVFATPAFCQSRLCGPVLEIVAQTIPSYRERVEFIHIEPYDLSLIRGEGRVQLVEATVQWGLPTEPWVFVVNGQGRLVAKFEGILALEELEGALKKALAGGT